MGDAHEEIHTERLVSYLVGEIWPRFVDEFHAETIGVYDVITKLTRVFLLPKEASPEQLQWFTEFFIELPDLVAWVLNELRIESNKLTSWDLRKKKSDIGALKFLVLIGIKDWSKIPNYSEFGSIEEAACQILKEDDTALQRRFENVFRKVKEREESHRKSYSELVKRSVSPYRSVAETYPAIGEKFPEYVEMLDKAAHELRVRESILGGISEIRRAIGDFAEALLQAAEPENDSDQVKEN